MFVDDPDHRDLNLISEQMLVKGAFYFDRPINRDDEVIINTVSGFRGNGPHPDAHVEVGTPEVVHPDVKKIIAGPVSISMNNSIPQPAGVKPGSFPVRCQLNFGRCVPGGGCCQRRVPNLRQRCL